MMGKVFIAAVLLLLLLGCLKTATVEIEDKAVVQVEVADTYEKITRGLMYRPHLPENAGMLFLYPEERALSYWMKNTLIPLDIIYIDSDFEIVDIHHAVPCEAEPCPHYTSKLPAQYVLEVNAGFAREKGVQEGDRAEFVLN